MVYMIQNGEMGSSYEETATFPTFEGLELMAPESGNGFKVTVPPQYSRLIIIKQSVNGYSMSKKYSYRLLMGENALYKQCLAEGKRKERAPGINQYLLQHQGGILIIY